MKFVSTIVLGLAVSGTAMAQSLTFEPTAQERKCGKGVYCMEKMTCVGRIDNPPKGMHDDYYVSVVTFVALKSAKNLGGGKKVLVDALQSNTTPYGETPNITLAEAIAQATANDDYSWGNYSSPARVKGNKVTAPGPNGFSTGVEFTIVSSEKRKGYRLDKLTGVEVIDGSVVGGYSINYECEAEIVEAPSRIDDFTKP